MKSTRPLLESLEPRLYLDAAYPTDYEQYMVELINRARSDPGAEVTRIDALPDYELSDLNEGPPMVWDGYQYVEYTITDTPKQPLAINPYLTNAARDHSQWMLDNNVFGHDGAGGSEPTDRMAAAGYVFTPTWYSGENISLLLEYDPIDQAEMTQFTAESHDMLFIDEDEFTRGHRINICYDEFKEIGVGIRTGIFLYNSVEYYAFLHTSDFAATTYNDGGGEFFFTGVVYDDSVTDDNFYTPGEGLGGVTITATNQSTSTVYAKTTWDSGGYSLRVPNGWYDIVASGGELAAPQSVTNVYIGNFNEKVDFVASGDVTDPVANDDTDTVDEDSVDNVIDVLANDTDAPHTAPELTVTGVSDPANGTAAIYSGGMGVTYTPDGDFFGTDTFTYTIEDPAGNSDTATVTITVDNVNDPPVAVDDDVATDEETPFTTIDLVADNDTDADPADTLTVTGIDTTGTLGDVTDNGDGTFDYDPAGQFDAVPVGGTDTDTFTYTISDGHGETGEATVTVTIDGVNDAPTAVDDAVSTDEDTPFTTADLVADNDDDPDDGDTLTVAGIDTTGTTGLVTDNGDGTFDYDPNGQFESLGPTDTDTDRFTYTISDGHGGTGESTVTITINGRNEPPVADAGGPYTMNEGDDLSLDGSGSVDPDADVGEVPTYSWDLDGDGIPDIVDVGSTPTVPWATLASLGLPSDGTALTITLYVDDGIDTDTDTASLTIDNLDPNPIGDGGGSYTTASDTPFTTGGVLANDGDPGGDTLGVGSFDDSGTQGLVTDNGDGTFDYDPNGAFDPLDVGESGTDTFTYTATDGDGGSATATVTITITGVDDPPVANAGGPYTMNEGDDLSLDGSDSVDPDADVGEVPTYSWDLDGDGTPDIVDVGATPTVSWATLSSLGMASDGTDLTIGLQVDDGTGTGTDATTLTIDNLDPNAAGDGGGSYTTDSDTAFTTGGVLANDGDPGGDTLHVGGFSTAGTAGDVTYPGGGTFSYDPNGVFDHLDTGENDTDTFTYTATDGDGGSATATVTITVNGVDDPPVAVDDTPAINEATPSVLDVLANDYDPEGDAFDIATVTQPADGTAVNNTTDVTYTPDVGFYGTDTFTYTISDGTGNTATATVTVTVNAVNDPPDNFAGPVAADYTLEGDIGVLGHNYDVETDDADLAYTVVTGPAHGWVRINDAALFEYEPDVGYTGTDAFQYTVTDRGEDAGTPGVDRTSDPITVNLTYDPAGPGSTVIIGGATNYGRWAQYTDAAGNLVNVYLVGAGELTVYRDVAAGAPGDAVMIGVTGTAPLSKLYIVTPKGTETTVGDIRSDGPLYQLNAATTHLRDDVTAGGPITVLSMEDVVGAGNDAYSDISLNCDGLALETWNTLNLNLGSAQDLSLDTGGMPVKQVLVEQWLETGGRADSMTAPYYGTIWSLGALEVPQVTATGADPGHGYSIIKFYAGDVSDVSVDTPGGIFTVSVASWLDTDPTPDAIAAGWIGGIYTKTGGFGAGLAITGRDAKGYALGKASIAGELSGTWDLTATTGMTGKVVAGSTGPGWTLNAPHSYVTYIATYGDMDAAAMTAGYYGTLYAVGTLRASLITALGGDPVYDISIMKLYAGPVRDVSVNAAGGIYLTNVADWLDTDATPDTIDAAWTTKFYVTGPGGDFHPDVTLDGTNALNGYTLFYGYFAGRLGWSTSPGSTWNITGEVGTFSVLKGVRNSRVQATGSIGKLSMGSSLGSDFLAGVKTGCTDRFADELTDYINDGAGNTAQIGSVAINGWLGAPAVLLEDSNFTAARLGPVYLRDYDAEDTYRLTVLNTEDNFTYIRYTDSDNPAANWHWWPGQPKPAQLTSGSGTQLGVVV